jgi:hypothetical protein
MTTRVRDVVHAAELASQRARLFNDARRFLARSYLGNADSSIEFDALSTVLEHLLLEAHAAEQVAQRLLARPVKRLSTPR